MTNKLGRPRSGWRMRIPGAGLRVVAAFEAERCHRCSARLPVYALLIAAFIPQRTVLELFNLQGVVLFTLYVAGIAAAIAVAYVLKFFKEDGSQHALLMELPSYRAPHARDVLIGLWERSRIFLGRV